MLYSNIMMNSKHIQEANNLMTLGKRAEAKAILDQLIAEDPSSRSSYASAVAIFLAGNMYNEAKELFGQYFTATGKSLEGFGGADFSLQDIEDMAKQAENKTVTDTNTVRLVGLPLFFYRFGSPGINFQRLTGGVTEIVMTADRIQLTRKAKTYTFRWDEITRAELISKQVINRQMNGYVNRISLYTAQGTFRFKLFPNIERSFENESDLLPELRKHLTFDEKRIKAWNASPVVRFSILAGSLLLTLFLSVFLRGR